MHEDSMKKLQGGCVSWLVLLTGAAQLLLVCGEGMFYLCMTSASNIHYWIPSTISLPVVCPSLPALNNGIVSYNNLILGLNTVATYTCDTGYTISVDSHTTRTCERDGVWSGLPPSCERKWNGFCTVCVRVSISIL